MVLSVAHSTIDNKNTDFYFDGLLKKARELRGAGNGAQARRWHQAIAGGLQSIEIEKGKDETAHIHLHFLLLGLSDLQASKGGKPSVEDLFRDKWMKETEAGPNGLYLEPLYWKEGGKKLYFSRADGHGADELLKALNSGVPYITKGTNPVVFQRMKSKMAYGYLGSSSHRSDQFGILHGQSKQTPFTDLYLLSINPRPTKHASTGQFPPEENWLGDTLSFTKVELPGRTTPTKEMRADSAHRYQLQASYSKHSPTTPKALRKLFRSRKALFPSSSVVPLHSFLALLLNPEAPSVTRAKRTKSSSKSRLRRVFLKNKKD
ncbi:hypothetical protein GCM10027044_15500 [Hymenobacter ruber]